MQGTLIREYKVDTQRAREISIYGCTVDQMREAVGQSLTFRFSGAAMMAASIISDCQEMLNYSDDDSMVREDIRQTLNRAKWILSTYCMKSGS